MKSFKLGLAAALLTGMMALAPEQAMAANSCAMLDCACLINNVKAEILDLNALLLLKDLTLENIQVVNIDESLNPDQVQIVKNSLNNLRVALQVLTLQNVLSGISVVDVLNNNNILTFADVLNANDIDISDVVAINVLPDGQVIVFGCPSWH